ncbi:HAD hydrolase-like protein [Flavobacterium litorale]|uniref:HAD hydrolase-like protein n=1 Tax=Flavobacterium litorale TaxID=2856519 RepID=A0ABX8V704_9FLAO|nr:HAD hydrolase-like protein [Flavobacterium litorale]QYJ68624.1 HAD hydrolase-like protein [Flavobacterium litorale]
MKAKLILFDFDGTLVDSKAIFFDLYNQLAKQKGFTCIDAENINHLRSLSIKQRSKYLGIPMYKVPFIAKTLVKQFYSSLSQLTFNPEIKELLLSLKAEGYTYCIVSTNAKKNIQAFFGMQNVAVPEVYTSSKIFGKDKLLRKLLKTKKLHPKQVLYIGDEARDIAACKKCGIPIVWVRWGYDNYDAIAQLPPDYIAANPEQLTNLLHELVSAQG